MTQQSTLEETDVNFTEPEPGNAADKELDTDKCKVTHLGGNNRSESNT